MGPVVPVECSIPGAYLDEGFPFEDAKRILAAAKDNQKYWYGDFYALTAQTTTDDAWCAYQLHRPDLNAGIAVVFRRGNSNYTGLEGALRGLVPGQTYAIELGESEAAAEKMSAEKLSAGVELRLPQKGSSQIIRYKVVGL